MIKAVLFDLDDTVTDRAASIREFAGPFASRFAGELGCIEHQEALRVGELKDDGYKPRLEVCQDILDMVSWIRRPAIDELLAFWFAEFPRCAIARPDLLSVLKALTARGVPMGVVTNGRTVGQNIKVDVLGLRPFLRSVVISEAAGIEKPHRAIFEAALESLGVVPAEAVFVGDHPVNDIDGARAVGMQTVWLRHGRAWPEGLHPPTHSINALSELLGLKVFE